MNNQSRENLDFLYRVFRDLCLSGKLDDSLVEAFHRVLDHIDVSNSYEQLEDFLSKTKSEAKKAFGNEVSLDFLNVDLTPDTAVNIDAETAYFQLWQAALRSREAATMAAVRLSMIRSFGEERQKELIGEWNL